MPSIIPFHIEIRHLYRNRDQVEHELKFRVVGVEKPAAVLIASEDHENPVVIERLSRGGLELPLRLIDAFAISCFRLLGGLIVEQGGESGWWTLRDARAWVRQTFAEGDAERILNELALHVRPGLEVRSVCLVADDDAI